MARRLSRQRYEAIVDAVNRYRAQWRLCNRTHKQVSGLLGAQTISDEDCINELVNNPRYTVDQLLADLNLAKPA